MILPRSHGDGHRWHHSDFGFRTPHFPDLRDFSRLTDNLLHRRHAEPLRSPESSLHWRYVPPPYSYEPPPPPLPSLYSPNSPQFAWHPAPTREVNYSSQNSPTPQPSVTMKPPAPSAPSSDEEWNKSIPAPSAPPAERQAS
ncbi:hypothetical protein JG688_00009913 [Phytophthora aleatoria]|uniref:Uncharacterized protein n=1 Tax=Phytophthora aleatoria TaxID=2496075 RepID=A0A8J5IFG8_9STRA|nr:hypothetical protein JG688_00009913 [Phytophthora aleatoria]